MSRVICLGLAAMAAFSGGAWALTPIELRCEYKEDPQGLDVRAPRLTWKLAANEAAQAQSAYQILVATSEEALRQDQADLWDSAKVASDETVLIPYAGKPLTSRMRCYWKVRVWNQAGEESAWSNVASWSMGLLEAADWAAKWIGYDAPVELPEQELVLPPAPYLRKEFSTEKAIRRATLYATALGIYEVEINGKRVGEAYFTPGWTDYHTRVQYLAHDVTDLVSATGQNAIGAILADGWYAGYLGFRLLNSMERPRNFYGGEPRLMLQLEIEYTDGATGRIVTDESWKASYGAIREADLLMGETHDKRLAFTGWTSPGFDDARWAAVTVSEAPEILVEAHRGEPVQRYEEFVAQKLTQPKPGVYVYDLGQNMVGWVRLKVSGAAGQRVQVRHSEMLQADGTLYTEALRKARAIDAYLLAGGGEEVLEPKFSFHGFRYVEITGLDTPPALEDVVGVVFHSPIPQTGTFECSEPLLNQLHHNIVWGQKGNYLEIPTDCPQRDERLGWTGDAQFFMPTAAYIADVGAFFTKWLVDLVQDSQLADGSWADVAPNVELGGGAVAWGDAAIICTYQMYQYYGDTRVIEQHFDRLVKGMDFLESTSENNLRSKLGYGDWVNLGGGAKDEVICTAYYAYLAGLMAEMAQVIGRDKEAVHYTELQPKIREAFIKNFVKEDGSILESSQTGYALAFTMGLIPEALHEQAARRFVEEIEKFDGHLATGFIGTPRLLPGLSLAGRRDVAYSLLMNKTFPSWLYPVTLGATTMWERWDGWAPEKGFQTPDMNSFNHYAFGAVGEYLYREVGGIQSEAPSFKRIRIAPHPGGGLRWAKTGYASIRGQIRSDWRAEGGKFSLEVVIPPNTTATVRVPAKEGAGVKMPNGQVAEFMGTDGDAALFQIASGHYLFESTLP